MSPTFILLHFVTSLNLYLKLGSCIISPHFAMMNMFKLTMIKPDSGDWNIFIHSHYSLFSFRHWFQCLDLYLIPLQYACVLLSMSHCIFIIQFFFIYKVAIMINTAWDDLGRLSDKMYIKNGQRWYLNPNFIIDSFCYYCSK